VVRIKQKILLDQELLSQVNEFYSSRLGEEVLGLECFSDPQLKAHICNIQALPDNEQPCEYCKNVVGRQCKVTCHIHYFCLAAFAFRLGIGETKRPSLKGGLSHNLKKISYKRLYELVMERLEQSDEGEKEEPTPPKDDAQLGLDISKDESSKKKRARKKKGPVFDEDDNELVTIAAAAKLYGCTYVNMYSHVRRGNVEKVVLDNMSYVRKKDVVEFRDKKKSNGSNTEG